MRRDFVQMFIYQQVRSFWRDTAYARYAWRLPGGFFKKMSQHGSNWRLRATEALSFKAPMRSLGHLLAGL
jgi:hypothetical protein